MPAWGADECFVPTVSHAEPEAQVRKWKVIIADDEEEVHSMTHMVLSDYTFDGQELEFLNAYSGGETLQLLSENPDTAMILLDVVMETEDAGLKVVHRIRRQMGNPFVRIILRTGQPGKAPETEVISEYDINDYKEKTELTAQKLYTAITSSLRTYRDLRIIDQNRKGLEKIVNASANLFENQSLRMFAQGVLMQLSSILQMDESTALSVGSAFTAEKRDSDFVIIAGTGRYESCVDMPLDQVVSLDVMGYLSRAIEEHRSIFKDDMYAGFFADHRKRSCHLLYLKGCRNLTEVDRNLISIFSSNVAVAFDNIALNQEMIDTQKEVIFTLGEVIESRSMETGHHVRRVAEMSYVLARRAGLSEKEAELLRLASPMHDVGKVGIPDAVLLKRGPLTPEEYEIIKQHTEIGHHILKNSQRQLLKASVIAARQHHEHWDGNGYPLGLKGDEIHIFGRITAVADVFDALFHKRVYKSAWQLDEILAYFRHRRGTQFDPRIVDILLADIEEFIAIDKAYPD
jgi:response regulator RpfG family c-di-GMP phosphodiesterase